VRFFFMRFRSRVAPPPRRTADVARAMRGAHVASFINAAERSRHDVVGSERIAEPRGLATDPAQTFFEFDLASGLLVGVAAGLESVAPAAWLAGWLSADDAGFGHRFSPSR
jgi:hypothetical protein